MEADIESKSSDDGNFNPSMVDENSVQTSLEFETESNVDDDASIEAHGIGINEELFFDFLDIVDLNEDYLIEELQSDNDGEGGFANKPRIFVKTPSGLGMEFSTLAEFKDVMLEYSVLIGREVKFVKND